MTIQQITAKVKLGELKCEDLVKYYLKKIDNNTHLNAYLTVFKESSQQKAIEIDQRAKSGEKLGKCAGVVMAVKDNLNFKGHSTTCASKILHNFESPYHATVLKKFLAEDAIIIGKTNLDQFSMGSSTENSYYGVTKNFADQSRVPGGSSGGSAVAVAADLAQVGLGSDTGGSIRQPAAFTGVVGLKPTYGRVSRYGLIAFASSLDQIGPISRSVTDTAAMLEVMAGYDNKDSTSSKQIVPNYSEYLNGDITKLKVGISSEYFSPGLDSEIKQRIYSILEQLKEAGIEIKDISLPHTQYGIATYYIIATAEASSNLARYDGVKYGFRDLSEDDLDNVYKHTRSTGFGTEVKRRIMLGTYVLSSGYYDAYYKKAQQVRRLIKQDFDNVFKEVDCIITPTSPTTAFKIGERVHDPLTMYLSDIYTVCSNLAGNCAISIPVGNDSNGLPIGLQIISDAFKENNLLLLANHVEQHCSY